MRIIAGSLRGRRLTAPKGLSTRPTSDRVREALFSALGPITGARVLDLCAGTGALGIEAISRGAAHATFVESAKPAVSALRENLNALGLGAQTTILPLPIARAIPLLDTGPYDVIFIDPPYAALAEVGPWLEAIVQKGLCSPVVRVIVEHASRDGAPVVRGLVARPSRRYGDTAVTFYDAAAPPSPADEQA